MARKAHHSPSSTNKTGSSTINTQNSRESTPGMAPTTPATSVHSTTPKRNRHKPDESTPAPADTIITKEMIQEEADLHTSSEQKELAESSQQVLSPSNLSRKLTVDEYR